MVEQTQKTFNIKDLQDKINSKESMYDFMTRKDWFLPSFKSPLCTLHFMQLVYEYKIYLPRQVSTLKD
jgi:hypothetical protein